MILRELASHEMKGVDLVALDLSSVDSAPGPQLPSVTTQRNWRGVLDRPVNDTVTQGLIESLCSRIGAASKRFPNGHIDAMFWAGELSSERLFVVGREKPLPETETAVYDDSGMVMALKSSELTRGVVADFTPLGNSAYWQQPRGDAACTVWLNGEHTQQHTNSPLVARFAPDGTALALIDALGDFKLLSMPLRTPR